MNQNFFGWTTFGHDEAIDFFLKSAQKNQLPHANLIVGPSRVGKTTLAFDLACLINLYPDEEKLQDQIIDIQKNDKAQRIIRGLNSDIRLFNIDTPYVLNGKKVVSKINISIEHIKTIKRETSIKPFESKSKVFIIQDCHNMTNEAANSFLKILEEPFENNYFILTTDLIDQIPETIVSRCQLVSLGRVNSNSISEMIEKKFNVNHKKSKTIARFSKGCPGWAISAVNDEILVDSYKQLFSRIKDVISSSIEQRLNYSRKLSIQFRNNRNEVYAELDGWVDWFRDLALLKNQLGKYILFGENIFEYKKYLDQLGIEDIVNSINIIIYTRENLEKNVSPNLTLDVLLLELPHVNDHNINIE